MACARTIVDDSLSSHPKHSPAKPDGAGQLAISRRFSEINPKPLCWLWPGRFPLGKLILLAGDPGLGKSLLSVDIAARVSTGTAFPDSAACERGSVVILSAEDDEGDTIRPRLDAACANVDEVHRLDAVRRFTSDGKSVEASFNLESDLPALEELVTRTGARLIIVDPISAYLGGVDSHTNADIRGLLSPLAALAAKHSVAVLAVTHLRKSAGAAIHRAMGSLAFAAAARAVWGVVEDPDDKFRRLMLPIKQNLSADSGGLAYRIEAPGGIPKIAWEPGAVTIRADDLMCGLETREDHSERREAEEWLKDFLADGPQPAGEVKRESGRVGLSWATIRRASGDLGVSKQKGGFKTGWQWSLSEDAHHEDAHPRHSEMSTFEGVTENKADSNKTSAEDAHSAMPEHLRRMSTFEEVEF